MLKRIALIVVFLAVSLTLAGSLALWVILSRWVPTKGKALVIDTVERHVPAVMSIGAMRYEPLRGFLLEEVRVTDPLSGDTWLAGPAIRVRIGWLPLLLSREVAFHAEAPITAPCRTSLTVSGRYRLRQPSLKLNISSEDIPVSSLTAPLTRHVPPALEDGTLRLRLHLRQLPDIPWQISGRVTGADLVWADPSWRLMGDAVIEGEAQPPQRPHDHWRLQAEARFSDARLEGFPDVGPISEIQGAIRISPEQLELRQVTGTALGSPWTLEGTVTLGERPSFEVLLTSRAALSPLIEAFPRLASEWKPDGAADVRAVCRGPLEPAAAVDCLARAEFRDVTLTGRHLAHPITRITGAAAYDLPLRRLSILQLEGRILDEALSLNGDVILSSAPALSLAVKGALPLTMAAGWLPPGGALTQVEGTAALDLRINGRGDAPRVLGRVELRNARATVAALAKTLEDVTGAIELDEAGLSTRGMTLRVDDRPFTLTGAVVPGAMPFVTASVQFPEGWCRLASRISPEELLIDDGNLRVHHSQVTLRGRLSRTAERPSVVRVEGRIELGELSAFPFAPLPALEPWRLRGQAAVEATVQGRLSRWADADIRGQMRADAVSIRDVPLEQALATFEQEDRVLRLRIPSAVVAGGRCSGELSVDYRERLRNYLAQADLTGVQLERFTQVIPAWRDRSVTGQASGHLALSGLWEERVTWRGSGWLNAQGRQLGDVPLLDTLFRGLFRALANRLGLETLGRGEVTQASLRWKLTDQRLFTDDLRLGGLTGGEPVALYAKGSVGLDGTLDLVIEPEFSEGTILQAPAVSSLAGAVLQAANRVERLRRLVGRHRMTGTLKNPDYRFEFSMQEVLKQLAPAPADLLQGLFDAVR